MSPTASMKKPSEKTKPFQATTLREILEEEGILEFVLAEHLGLTKSGLSRKLNGTRPWKHSEILATLTLLRREPGSEVEVFPEMFQ
jgi:hypothetical protein